MNKQHILDEIRRTAQANGGRALGRQRFESATGIKETDWRGKYWARWSDAVQEAGFSANELTAAYDEAHLLAKLADLVRELGHYPTSAEVRLKRRRDVKFPDQKVYERFGVKANQAAKLLAYCLATPGYADVADLCRPIAATATADVSEHDEDEDDAEPGFVYLIKAGRHYKIGRSNAAGRREREIALQLPEKADTVHVIATDDPPGIEGYWHQRFAAKRLNGEWFALTAADVPAFKRRKFQ